MSDRDAVIAQAIYESADHNKRHDGSVIKPWIYVRQHFPAVAEIYFVQARAVLRALSAAPGEAVGREAEDDLKFMPHVSVERQAGVTVAIFEDVATIARPLHPGVYHFVDELRAMDDDRLVGVQLWTCEPFRVLPAADREAIREAFKNMIRKFENCARAAGSNQWAIAAATEEARAALALVGEG